MPTLATRASTNGQSAGQELLEQLAPGRSSRHRSWPRVGAGVALAIISGSIFVALYASEGSRHPYLAVARPVAVGETVVAADLTTVRMPSASALDPIPAGQVDAVIGRRAAVGLVPGTLLTGRDLASGPILGRDQASVGLDLKPGQVPAGLAPGGSVAVIETTGAGSGAVAAAISNPTVLVSRATVLSAVTPTNAAASNDTEVTLVVPADLAAAIATAAAAGQVAVVGVSPEGSST